MNHVFLMLRVIAAFTVALIFILGCFTAISKLSGCAKEQTHVSGTTELNGKTWTVVGRY